MKLKPTSGQGALPFIFITLLLDVIGLGIIIPVLPNLIRQLTGSSISHASVIGGWLMFLYAIMQFFFAPVLGNLSDKFGRRPILLASVFGFGLDYLLQGFAPTIGWLFLGRILAGITGASFTTASAYIADISTPEKKAQNFGMIGAAFGLGFIIGPVIGGLLGGYGARVPFYAAAAVSFLNWAYGYFILPESLSIDKRRPFDWKRANPLGALSMLRRYPVLFGLAGSMTAIWIAAHATQSTWTFITMEKFNWNSRMIGLSLGTVGLCVVIVQGGLIRFINPALGQKRSVYVGLLLNVIGFALFAFATRGWMMFIFLIPYCLGGISGPALQGIMSSQVPDNEQGELQGALTSLMSITSIIGPLLMTNLFAWFTGKNAPFYFPTMPFLAGAVLALLSLLLAMRSLKGYVHNVN